MILNLAHKIAFKVHNLSAVAALKMNMAETAFFVFCILIAPGLVSDILIFDKKSAVAKPVQIAVNCRCVDGNVIFYHKVHDITYCKRYVFVCIEK